ncbi:MAG: bifunctional diaminohydroxyphosphoribosylaminopyrimidine deaminase/5-amino-6-(5-phosphoribosylamino)uracil reductase RibD [Gemmatimonadota bacterium]|nr:bifunctional diaminohydroxyphosphoribosylaminopyrimidine deaminase/5-amino-6-(5-phosphoribosylamino)uracil reductase RibD [Gemmatimonadota bacterium]
MDERAAMTRAVALALRGWGRVAPNPMVGAVLLKDGRVIGEGFHAEHGGPHAELAALSAAADPAGATCVVTLEPCAHHGKTPPCAEALVAKGVRRVVIAGRDPDPVSGDGVARLREAGVAIELGLGAEAAAAANAAFLWSTVRPARPFVAVKVATSLDGFIADRAGRSRWISGGEAREFVHWLRAGFDGIAVGRRTAVRDDPQLTVRGPIAPRVPPARIVFAGRGPLAPSLACLDPDAPGRALVVRAAGTAGPRRAEPGELAASGVTVLETAGLPEALAALRREGVRALLVEGGGRLVGALLDAGLVDRVYQITAPLWLGDGTPAFGQRAGIGLAEAPRWSVTERRALGQDSLVVVDRELCLLAS